MPNCLLNYSVCRLCFKGQLLDLSSLTIPEMTATCLIASQFWLATSIIVQLEEDRIGTRDNSTKKKEKKKKRLVALVVSHLVTRTYSAVLRECCCGPEMRWKLPSQGRLRCGTKKGSGTHSKHYSGHSMLSSDKLILDSLHLETEAEVCNNGSIVGLLQVVSQTFQIIVAHKIHH